MTIISDETPTTDITELFPPNEGLTKTLGVNLPPSVAMAIRRTGNRKNSISAQLLSLLDPEKLRKLIEEDAAHQERCSEGPLF